MAKNDENERPVELELTEAFHRMKRTSLLFSVTLLLAYIPTLQIDQAPLLTAFHEVPADLVRTLLLMAASYYFFGFLLEYLAARRANRAPMSKVNLKELRDFASETSRLLHGLRDWRPADEVERLKELAELAMPQVAYLDELNEAARAALPEIQERPVRISAFDELLPRIQNLRDAAGKHWEARRMHLEKAANEAAGIHNVLFWMQEHLKEQADKIVNVNSRISVFRRVQFHAWELGGAAVPFALALLAYCFPTQAEAGWVLLGAREPAPVEACIAEPPAGPTDPA